MESQADHALPSFSTHDVLDKSLYIRPRFKKSAPLRKILSESYEEKERHWLPVEFRKLITQFMIANGYIYKAAYLYSRASLFESLLSRLDLHPESNSSAERVLLRMNVKRVEKFIESKSKYWQKKGYLHHRKLADGELEVKFSKHMLEWIDPSYEGKMITPKEWTTTLSQSGLEELVAKADDDDEPHCLANICRREVDAAAQDLKTNQFASLNLANSPPRAHTSSPRTNKDRLAAAKNVNLAKEILDDTLMANKSEIKLKSRRQFGYVQQLLDMAQDSLPGTGATRE